MTDLHQGQADEVAIEIPLLRRVDNSVYSAATYEDEIERIFRRTWTFTCHESELPNSGSYMRRRVGGDPVVIVRGDDGVVRGFHNVCRHRGSLVAIEECGQARSFLCPYHNWSYSVTDGSLKGVPGIEAYDGTGFRKEDHGLVPLRVETLFGFVFACIDEDAPTLETYIGEELMDVLRTPLAHAELEVFHREQVPFRSNWKGFAENIRDGYHVPFVHPFLRKASPPKEYRLFDNFHSVQYLQWGNEAVTEEQWAATAANPLPGFEVGEGYLAILFPDTLIAPRSNVVETLTEIPISPTESVLEIRALGIVGDSPDVRSTRSAAFDIWLAMQPPQDVPVLEWQQEGLESRTVRTSIIARGPDARSGRRGDDNRLRQFWEGWRHYMRVDSNVGRELER